ncbi:MAG: hypothetical protein ACLUI3_04920 [Christensenellales bacterium]
MCVTGSVRFRYDDALEQSGIHVFIGQRENVDGADIVIYSAAIAKSKFERVRRGGIPQMERAAVGAAHGGLSPRRQRLRHARQTTTTR